MISDRTESSCGDPDCTVCRRRPGPVLVRQVETPHRPYGIGRIVVEVALWTLATTSVLWMLWGCP